MAPNLLAQQFTAAEPNQKWLADLTYIATAEGWLYLAGVMDLCSRKIVGWAMDERMTTDLVTRALQMACRRRQPAPGLLHHSDRAGTLRVQYASHDYQRVLAAYGMVGSMSRRGNCYDNAPIESFWGTLKTEAPDTNQRWATHQQAKTAIFTYIEGFYNHRRLHSALGYQSPDEFERLLALGE